MSHFKVIIFTSLLLLSTVTHAETDKSADNGKNEGLGFSIGALIGGLIAGPPGAVIGAAGGSLFGNNKSRKEAHASLESQLQEKNYELALLQDELSRNKAKYIASNHSELARAMHNVTLKNKHSTLMKLENGLSMAVYFRTNDHAIDSTLLPHIHELATLINDYPELNVQLYAHADHRGKPDYNMTLSKSRALSVRDSLIEAGVSGSRIYSHSHGESNAINKDSEGLIFDRRVDIQLTINTEV
jgi:outer membrane protein OmpA-like peptidoglycan-associated protein